MLGVCDGENTMKKNNEIQGQGRDIGWSELGLLNLTYDDNMVFLKNDN